MFCGPDSMLEVSGVALKIDTDSLVLSAERLSAAALPHVGERVRVELLLPTHSPNAAARYLSFRALVVHVEKMADRSHISLTFRKPRVMDHAANGLKKKAKSAGPEWEM